MNLRIFKAIVVVVAAGLARAYEPAPVALEPNGWLGIDGNWSALGFKLGSNSQPVNVLVSTTLSEFWAVSAGGCLSKEPHCNAARGGVYTPSSSNDWSPLGLWQLGLDYLGYGGNGEYGLDTISAINLLNDVPFTMSDVLMAAVNTTDFFNGLFGLGLTQGSFGDTVAQSPLTQAVKKYGWIPSYSYGFTAGAHYRNMPASLTLGGYDASRFIDQSIGFTLGQADGMARPLVRGIEVSTSDSQDKPELWKSNTVTLSGWNTSFDALIDSSTPYLWLPDEICDSFAVALNLTYNDTLDLYTLSNDQYNEYMKEDSFRFNFVLSSFDNTDDFGEPFNVQGIVNITVPSRALVGLLQYPFKSEAIEYGDPAVPFFSLRRTHNSSTFIIGRSFLQESYLVARYDEGLFSIHQAVFPDDPYSDAEITAILQPDNSPYPPPAVQGNKGKLSKGQLAGISVGVVSACLVALAGWVCYRRQRRPQCSCATATAEESKEVASSMTADTPKTPLARLLSKIARLKRSSGLGKTTEKLGQQPSEVPNSEIYELPAPIPVVELDGDDGASLNGDTELGTGSTQNTSAYEAARRKMDRQLQGFLPAYTPPIDGVLPPPEKTSHDISPPDSAVRLEPLSPTSPTRSLVDEGHRPNSLPGSLPSPIPPWMDWAGHEAETPSPTTSTFPPSYRHGESSSGFNSPLPLSSSGNSSGPMGMSECNHDNPPSPLSSSGMPLLVPPSPIVPKPPVNVSNAVCLGPLPEEDWSTQGPSPSHVPNSVIPGDNRSLESLGSNFTVEEERRGVELANQANAHHYQLVKPDLVGRIVVSPPEDAPEHGVAYFGHAADSTVQPSTRCSQGRIDPGTELIHVPQPAERRYSWEERRFSDAI